MDLDSGCGRERQNLAADRCGQFTVMPEAAVARWRGRRILASIVAVSLLAHGCLILAVLFFDEARVPPKGEREIPVELVREPPAPLSKPATAQAGEKSGAPPRYATQASNREPQQMPAAQAKSAAQHQSAKPRLEAKGGPARHDEAIEKQWAAAGLTFPFDMEPDQFRAVAVPLPSESGGEVMSYKVIVFGLLARVKHYPEAALQRHARGIAVIDFVLDDSGGVVSVSLLRSSGDTDLDAESVALVNRAAPFPPPPPGAERAFVAEVAFGMGR